MAGRSNQSAWTIFFALLLVNGALYGSVMYLKYYNPAHWAYVTQDLEKVLLASQFPDRLEANSIAFNEATQVELIGSGTVFEPRRAEVFINTMNGRKVRIHYGSRGMYKYAEDLALRLGAPLSVQNYERELTASTDADEAAPVESTGSGQPPALPDAR